MTPSLTQRLVLKFCVPIELQLNKMFNQSVCIFSQGCFLTCHRKYSQSEYIKAVVSSWQYYTPPSHHAPHICCIDSVGHGIFSMVYNHVVMQHSLMTCHWISHLSLAIIFLDAYSPKETSQIFNGIYMYHSKALHIMAIN